MALPIFSSPSFTFNKTFSPKNGSLSLAIKNSNFTLPIHCKATSHEVANDHQNEAIPRRSFTYQPSVWSNDYIQSLNSEYKEEIYAEKSRVLREEVRMMFNKIENEVDQMEFIDVIQRLGVAYHFKNEIKNILDTIYNNQTSNLKKNLHATALKFRLLRQHRYDISTDVFDCFQDEICDFKKNQLADVEGMLSMYEASFHSFEDETTLDEARDFTSKFLKEFLNQNGDSHMSLQISHALELPLHWRVSRWEARCFINIYEKQQNKNDVLLEFAKLDFNILQSIYQEELKYTSRWWKNTEIEEKLRFARDRTVENFVWNVAMSFNPEFEYFRKVLTKVNTLITIIDDVYDVYGTLEELELFTEAIDRWDLNSMDSLPHYMKICYHTLDDFVNEVEFEILNKTGYSIIPYLKKAWTDLCKAYLIEAKWYHSGYTPTFEEYIENAWISISAPLMLIHAYISIPNSFKIEDLYHLEENSNIIRYSAMILRLANDLGTSKRETEIGDIPKSIQCYVNETGASEIEAREHVKSMIYTIWKKMNKEECNSPFSKSFIDIAINLGRMALFMYQHGDGHSIQDSEIQNRIQLLIWKPIPIISKEY
ncbi:terpene synthase 10-like [Vicia villosa]|uniref:terpene synthase 10-like n=1 Tax=Vicia villosa TaxID=3911 RepID=UPI00273A961A|nr:terpene synthase 10-like [Vicia villosa]